MQESEQASQHESESDMYGISSTVWRPSEERPFHGGRLLALLTADRTASGSGIGSGIGTISDEARDLLGEWCLSAADHKFKPVLPSHPTSQQLVFPPILRAKGFFRLLHRPDELYSWITAGKWHINRLAISVVLHILACWTKCRQAYVLARISSTILSHPAHTRSV